jgi:hypothetical protein
MVIFNSYVQLPEGMIYIYGKMDTQMKWCYPLIIQHGHGHLPYFPRQTVRLSEGIPPKKAFNQT